MNRANLVSSKVPPFLPLEKQTEMPPGSQRHYTERGPVAVRLLPEAHFPTAVDRFTVSTGNAPLVTKQLWSLGLARITASSDNAYNVTLDCFVVDFDESATGPASAISSPRSWWETEVYELLEKNEDTKALRVLYRAVEGLFAKRNLEVLEKSLERIELKQLTPDLMVALIRSTYRARRALPSWNLTLERIKNELQTRNVPDWQRLLVGL